jgi:beta-galactosidase/beta-glucuronidase
LQLNPISHEFALVMVLFLLLVIDMLSVLQVGFRHTAIKEGCLIHNGRPLLLRGVNRHEFDDTTGEGGRR